MPKNIFLENTMEAPLPYVGPPGGGGKDKYPIRNNPSKHAEKVLERLKSCVELINLKEPVEAIRKKDGFVLEFSGEAKKDFAIDRLENIRKGIRILNVKIEDDVVKASVYIPFRSEEHFIKKVQDFVTSLDKKKPDNNNLIRSIEDVQPGKLESLWIGDTKNIPTDDPVWCEIWLRYEQNRFKNDKTEETKNEFFILCNELKIEINQRHIRFPEEIVCLIKANRTQLNNLLLNSDYIAEIRRAPKATSTFINLKSADKQILVNDLLKRTTFIDTNATVCLLDTGLYSGHKLIAQAVRDQDVQSLNNSWGTGDLKGHGTEMAGIVLYFDLKECLDGNKRYVIPHKIESVKILPPRGENPPELYGAITNDAVYMAERENPNAKRAVCMAVTAPVNNTFDGSPTSWSAAIDNITSGVDGNDEKRLFLVSAGNVQPDELRESNYPDANIIHSVEDPGQSWNALTVGAYSKDVSIENDNSNFYTPIAKNGDLSPFSSTSRSWSKKWPVKPEILFDGGNFAISDGDYANYSILPLLTTHRDTEHRLFSTIHGTSSATAQAAWMAAQLFAEYPGIWPETVRALLVHSARWTDNMITSFCFDQKKSGGIKNLLRICGYGIPDLDRARQCLRNSVNMIIEDEIQPFEKSKGQIQMKDMHLHTLPWPAEVLEKLAGDKVELRVTLSYFIEPGPGEKGWKDRYRYPSCGLRFELKNTNQSEVGFKKSINRKERGDDSKDKGDGSSCSERWFLGGDNRDVGSIHSDYIYDSAINLYNVNQIAIYPVIGWWRERDYLGKYNNKIRYSLIVSLYTQDDKVDFYTPIITEIKNNISNAVPIEIPTP